MPTIPDGRCINIVPCSRREPHCIQLINTVDVLWVNSRIVDTDRSLDELGTIMGFKASYYPLIIWLNMGCEIGPEVLDADVLKAIGNDMSREIVLKEDDLASIGLKLLVPLLDPVLIELRGHPRLRIVSIVEPELGTCLLVECSWTRSLTNDQRRKFL